MRLCPSQTGRRQHENEHSPARGPERRLTAVAFALPLSLLLLLPATAAAQDPRTPWTVTCGLPQGNPLLDLVVPDGYRDPQPWPGDAHSGHLMVKKLTRHHPESGIRTELWLLSQSVGWWKVKSIRVHPDDMRLFEGWNDFTHMPDVRQIIESPFLARSVTIRGSKDEDLVNG